jgi:hypothetical protein
MVGSSDGTYRSKMYREYIIFLMLISGRLNWDWILLFYQLPASEVQVVVDVER